MGWGCKLDMGGAAIVGKTQLCLVHGEREEEEWMDGWWEGRWELEMDGRRSLCLQDLFT